MSYSTLFTKISYSILLIHAFFLPTTALSAEQLTNDEMREIMVEETLNTYTECPCPYSPDGIGGICGTHSLYYEPGRNQIYCYYSDISNREIYFYRLTHAFVFPPPEPPKEEKNAKTKSKTQAPKKAAPKIDYFSKKGNSQNDSNNLAYPLSNQ